MYGKIKVPVYVYGRVETTGSYNLSPTYRSHDPLFRNLPISDQSINYNNSLKYY